MPVAPAPLAALLVAVPPRIVDAGFRVIDSSREGSIAGTTLAPIEELQAQRVGPRDETGLFRDLLTQARLADSLGFGCWWVVEHHGAGEYSYSAAPELLLSWIATQTSRLRLGHSGVLAPFRINHPIRTAERAAMLDHISSSTSLRLHRSPDSSGSRQETPR